LFSNAWHDAATFAGREVEQSAAVEDFGLRKVNAPPPWMIPC